MFEVGIISIIVLAVSYWVILWLMSRHDDVLHGDFVHAEDGAEASARPDALFPARPPFPPKPMVKRAMAQPAVKPSAMKPPDVKPLDVKFETPPAPTLPTPASVASSERSDTLQRLLASIKQDLKDASQL